MKLYISTLGVFDIKLEDTSIIKDSSRSYRLYKLLQYFITFKNKKILADTIIENIWPDHQSYDPYNMLRAQIYRLRQLIKTSLPKNANGEDYMSIVFSNGYYQLNLDENVIIDIDQFQNFIELAEKDIEVDIYSSIENYENALNLYKGSYLEENSYEIWLVPIKNYYSSLYLRTLFKLLELLESQQNYRKVISICQDAIVYMPENEQIHIYLMDAMLKLGQIKDARSHYEYMSFLLNKNSISNPSSALQEITRKIKNHLSEKRDLNLLNIKQKLKDVTDDGPLLCDFNYFKFLFNMQKRKRNMIEEPDFISLITLRESLNEEELEHWSNTITSVLKNSLRQGDAYTFWNDTQILVLLQNVQDNGIRIVEKRIKDNLISKLSDTKYEIRIKSTAILDYKSLPQEINN